MSTLEDRWLASKLAEGEQRKAAMKEEANRIRQQIRDGKLRITPEARDDYTQARDDQDWWVDVDTRGLKP